MNMKKLLCTALALIMAFALVACGNANARVAVIYSYDFNVIHNLNFYWFYFN